MRKGTKIAVLVAVLSLVAAMTAFAGWQLSADGQWQWLDSDGEPVMEQFKKSADGNWYYLGEDGNMVTDEVVEYEDEKFYVDANGKRVAGTWVAVPADDDDAELDVDHRWYYFGATGKAYKATSGAVKKTINGKTYLFGEDGKMLYGLLDNHYDLTEDPTEALYYYGDNDDGSAQTVWYHYEDTLDGYDDIESFWFRFNKGAKLVDQDKKIDGISYTFDADGVMTSGWGNTYANSTSFASLSYFNAPDEGNLTKKAWQYIYPIGKSEEDGDDKAWYYFASNGAYLMNQVKKIDGKYFGFAADGKMVTGLQSFDAKYATLAELATKTTPTTGFEGIAPKKVNMDSESAYVKAAKALYDASKANIYFFQTVSDGNKGMLRTGTVSVDLGDDTVTMVFGKDGLAYNGIVKDKLYQFGILKTAGSNKYIWVQDYTATDETWYVVNSNGTFVKAGKYVTDADGAVYAVRAKTDTDDAEIAKFYESDYAKKAAAAWLKHEDTFEYDKTTLITTNYISEYKPTK